MYRERLYRLVNLWQKKLRNYCRRLLGTYWKFQFNFISLWGVSVKILTLWCRISHSVWKNADDWIADKMQIKKCECQCVVIKSWRGGTDYDVNHDCLNFALGDGIFNILNVRQQNSIITARMPLFHLMAGGENIFEISALIGELKNQREELSTERVMVWFTIISLIHSDLFLASFLQFPYSDAGSKLFSFDLKNPLYYLQEKLCPRISMFN